MVLMQRGRFQVVPTSGVLVVALALTAPAAPPPSAVSIKYTAPSGPEAPSLESYDFDKWEVGQELFVASDEVNLREGASPTAQKVASLPMGSKVTVRTVASEAVLVQERVDRWYRVDVDAGRLSGYLFGGALTPIRFGLDFDSDGEQEVVTVAMSWNFTIRVRVLEPAVKGPGRVMVLDLPPSGGEYLNLRGGNAIVAPLAATTAGIALLQVDSAPMACADFSRAYVSYAAPGNKPGTPGKLAVALRLGGFADGGTFNSFEVEFKPRSFEAVVLWTSGEDDEEGQEVTTRTTERFHLRGAVFKKE